METSTGNNILATKYQLALDVQKKPGRPTFQDCMTMVLAARQRGWDALEISGSPEFQKQMYLACRAMGMPVKNFEPTPEMQAEAENIDKRFNPNEGPSLADCCDDLDRRFPQLEELQKSLPVPEMSSKEKEDFDPREPREETLEKAKELGLGPCPRPVPDDAMKEMKLQLQELQKQLQKSKTQAQEQTQAQETTQTQEPKTQAQGPKKVENLPKGVSEIGYATVSALSQLKENKKNMDPDQYKLICGAIKMYHANAVGNALEASAKKKEIPVPSAEDLITKAREKVEKDLKKNSNPNMLKLLSNYNNEADAKMRGNRQKYARQTGQKMREFDFKNLNAAKNKRPENSAVAAKKNDGYTH